MTLQTSGQMSTADIQTELGLSGEFSTDHPSVKIMAGTTTGNQIVIPTDFYGKTAAVPQAALPADFNVLATQSSGTATATVTLTTAGDITSKKNSAAVVDEGDWINDKTGLVSSEWETQAVLVSGTDPGGLGVWQTLSSARFWDLSRTGLGLTTGVIDITIRRIDDISNSDTIRITLTANVES